MVTGKDTSAAVDTPGPLLMLNPATRRAGAATAGARPAGLPPMPHSAKPLNAAAAFGTPMPFAPRAAVAESSSDASPAHTGVGVLAPASGAPVDSPELVPVTTPGHGVALGGGTLKAAGAPRGTPKATAAPPVYHPPMRTGVSSVSSAKKATIGATARKTGLKAVQEHQAELLRAMKARRPA
jgi:hypothetical protein